MNYLHIETAVAKNFGWRQNIIVPNVSWALFPRQEVDLLIIRPSGWAIEIEIKMSKSDIKADLSKNHVHWNKLIKQTWFAVPEKLATCEFIPAYAGILSISEHHDGGGYITGYICKTIRSATINKQARRLTDREINIALHCGCMRIWSLKEHGLNRVNNHERSANESLENK